jgi:hypothetical protein
LYNNAVDSTVHSLVQLLDVENTFTAEFDQSVTLQRVRLIHLSCQGDRFNVQRLYDGQSCKLSTRPDAHGQTLATIIQRSIPILKRVLIKDE